MKTLIVSAASRISIKVLFVSLLVVLVLSLAVSATLGYLYFHSQNKAQGNQLSEKEIANLVKEVNEVIILPDETPTVATVTDKEQLAAQPFFQKAENGDQVLIFQTAQKAYLYRPSTKKIIEVSTINLQEPQTSQSGDTTTSPDLAFTVALYNGTSTVGLTTPFQERLQTAFPKATVTSRQNAVNTSYDKSFLVDVAGNQGEAALLLSQTLQLPIQPMPQGEATPSAQFLIILGSDAN